MTRALHWPRTDQIGLTLARAPGRTGVVAPNLARLTGPRIIRRANDDPGGGDEREPWRFGAEGWREISKVGSAGGSCATGSSPTRSPSEIGSRGAAELKRGATEAVNERLRPVRQRRSELMADRGHLRAILRDGSEAARSIAQRTLSQVAAGMHTSY